MGQEGERGTEAIPMATYAMAIAIAIVKKGGRVGGTGPLALVGSLESHLDQHVVRRSDVHILVVHIGPLHGMSEDSLQGCREGGFSLIKTVLVNLELDLVGGSGKDGLATRFDPVPRHITNGFEVDKNALHMVLIDLRLFWK